MTDDRQLIETIRSEWAPESPHPGAFDARLAQRLRASRRRRVALVTVTAGAVLLALALVLVPGPAAESTAEPTAEPAAEPAVILPEVAAAEAEPVDVWWDAALSSSSGSDALPVEYAALSSLFLEPLSMEGT